MKAVDKFKVEVFNQILDTASMSIMERFVPNKELFLDCSWFDPEKLKDISKFTSIDEFPSNTFQKLSELTGLSRLQLLEELKEFASHYETLTSNWRKTHEKETKFKGLVETEENFEPLEGNEDEPIKNNQNFHSTKDNCASCLGCILMILYNLTTMSSLFHNLYAAVKFILLLPCTQIHCERCFSKLKLLKTFNRSLLGQNLLVSLMIMFIESDLLEEIDVEDVINDFGNSSAELKRLLF